MTPDQVTEQEPWGRDRRKAIEACDLDPGTLLGSWFLVVETGRVRYQGIIVAEPRAGVYLVQIEDSVPGARCIQRVVDLEQMIDTEGAEWRFYDNEEAMRSAFAEWTYHHDREAC